eukprot:6206230-Pleurochrysis_carterae.AAC.4
MAGSAVSGDVMYHLMNMPLLGSAGYLATIYMLNRVMRTQAKPLHVSKQLLVLYNAIQVVINLYVAIEIARPLGGRVWGMGLQDSPEVRYGVFLHYLCKVRDGVSAWVPSSTCVIDSRPQLCLPSIRCSHFTSNKRHTSRHTPSLSLTSPSDTAQAPHTFAASPVAAPPTV